jgi:hypothetical protein
MKNKNKISFFLKIKINKMNKISKIVQQKYLFANIAIIFIVYKTINFYH